MSEGLHAIPQVVPTGELTQRSSHEEVARDAETRLADAAIRPPVDPKDGPRRIVVGENGLGQPALSWGAPVCSAAVATSDPARSRARARRGYAAAIARALVTIAIWLVCTDAAALPGQALRLGGVRGQGPASTAVTALHHNPAMLARLRRAAFHAAMMAGLEQEVVRRNAIDPDTGTPLGAFASRTSLVHPAFDYFIGGSLHFDPVAIGLGIYSLGTQMRIASADPLRWHLAPDPDRGCLDIGTASCPPNGGQVSYRHDLTAAVAYDGGSFQLGVGVHFPMARERFAYDQDTSLGATGTTDTTCLDKEDPACAERLGFKGWTRWVAPDGAPPGFDAALSFGVGAQLRNDTISLGARYRTFPVRRAGEIAMSGVALVCRPDADFAGDTGVPACTAAQPIGATLRQRLPQEVALGAALVLGPNRDWRLDLNLYWLDLCQGGARRASCRDDGAQVIRLVGLDRRAFALPELTRYRGLQDVYGIDAYVSYRAHARASVLFAGHASTAPVRRAAARPGGADGARLGVSAGSEIRLRPRGGSRITLLLTPGYGLDVSLPRRVSPQQAAYSPAAAADFAASGGDINAEGADAVLDGRARSTNAGRYFGLTHTFSLALSWGDAAGE